MLFCNQKTETFSLTLSKKDAKALMVSHKTSLQEHRRVEFGESVLPQLIDAFCDSPYIVQENYLDVLCELQDIFYFFKNESFDQLTDGELIGFMKKQFETIGFGDLDYLRDTCLERFARSVRSGTFRPDKAQVKDEYSLHEASDEYDSLSEETRWEYELYQIALEDIS